MHLQLVDWNIHLNNFKLFYDGYYVNISIMSINTFYANLIRVISASTVFIYFSFKLTVPFQEEKTSKNKYP